MTLNDRHTSRQAAFYALLALIFCLSVAPPLVQADSIEQPTIAIIIDDMGNHYQHGMALISLPYPITLSFLPERRFTQRLTEQAHYSGKEIMLHAPMENSLGLRLGPGALTNAMTENQIKRSLKRSLQAVPYAVGVNNHMGSALTENAETMRWVMETLQPLPYYFVDSRTTAQSVANQMAIQHQVPSMSRDIFLDHEQTWEYVQQQFHKLLRLAKKNGTAVAIAHPHKVTIDYLTAMLPRLDEIGFRISSISTLWQIKHPGKEMFAQSKNTLKAGQSETRLAKREQDEASNNF